MDPHSNVSQYPIETCMQLMHTFSLSILYHTHTLIHTHTHTRTHSYTHTHAHTHTYTHIHSHTHTHCFSHTNIAYGEEAVGPVMLYTGRGVW